MSDATTFGKNEKVVLWGGPEDGQEVVKDTPLLPQMVMELPAGKFPQGQEATYRLDIKARTSQGYRIYRFEGLSVA